VSRTPLQDVVQGTLTFTVSLCSSLLLVSVTAYEFQLIFELLPLSNVLLFFWFHRFFPSSAKTLMIFSATVSALFEYGDRWEET
jgi:hypothetical protein